MELPRSCGRAAERLRGEASGARMGNEQGRACQGTPQLQAARCRGGACQGSAGRSWRGPAARLSMELSGEPVWGGGTDVAADAALHLFILLWAPC
eukprot:5463615-Pyramimonas_sp.AAC.1